MKQTAILSSLAGVLLLGLAASAQAAVSNIDLGVAQGYSGFFFGNASKVMDVEGRFAVGGNLDTSGFSFGYRAPYGSSGPSLVVGGNVKLGTGAIYAAPLSNVDTNASVGPITSWEKPLGYGVFGGSNSSLGVHDLRQGNLPDFAAAKNHLVNLSNQLANEHGNGLVEKKWGGVYLTGDNTSNLQVFNVSGDQLSNLFLQNINPQAQVVINVTGGSGRVVFSGGQDGQLEQMRDRVLFNLVNASEVRISTFTYGTILATRANMVGTGHVEGTVIADSISAQVEIGYEPWHHTSPVPEAESWAMLLAGLGVMGVMGVLARRRQRG